MRIGLGYDIHALVAGRKLVLGGVAIPFEKGLLGHSDADVLAHAVADAILGAAALGDIGRHFPDTDPAFKGADSLKLLAETVALVQNAGYAVVNVDATIVAEAPRLAPFNLAMRQGLAGAMGLSVDCVSVKATTHEGFGAEGRKEAISCQAVALLEAIG